MRTGKFLPTLTVSVLAGCQWCGIGNPPQTSRAAPVVATAKPGVIAISPANASIKFTGSTTLISHEGRFESFDGTLEMPTKDPKDATIRVKVDVASLATSIGLLTKHLKGEDFFDMNRYPTAQFRSERIAAMPDGRYQVIGEMTIHGVSQIVTFPASFVLTGDEVRFDATLTLSQTAFGMSEAARKTNDEVPVTVSIRGQRK